MACWLHGGAVATWGRKVLKVKITKTYLESFIPSRKIEIVRDAELQGFGVRVTPSGAMSFVVERKMSGRTVRHTIGRFGPWTVQQARADALQKLALMERGINPNEVPPVLKLGSAPREDLTLKTLVESYLAERASIEPAMKPRTVQSYRKLLARGCNDWMSLPFPEITRAMIVERMAALTADGPTQANNIMRALRAVLNWAVDNDAYITPDGLPIFQLNPVAVLSKRRLWNKDRRLTRTLDLESMSGWWAMVDRISADDWPGRADVIRDYWRLLFFTGMRPGEAARIEIGGWDSKLRELAVIDPKNREDVFVLPLGDFAAAIVESRAKKSRESSSPWLFPAPRREGGFTASGHEIRQAMCIASGIEWTFGDLRRTFASQVERLGVSGYMLKRVMGHKSKDVTGGYVQHDREQVRAVMQRVETALLAAAKVPSGT